MNLIAGITRLKQRHKFLAPLAVFLISLISFGYLEWSPYISDPDSFYHIKMALLMSKFGIIHNFPYLPFTVLKNIFIDHHLLYHALMIPFVTLLPPIIGAKIFQAIIASLLIVVFYFIISKLKIKFPLFFTLALLISPAFVFRMSLIKAQPLSLIILLTGLFFILKRKKLPLIILSFIYVWVYGGWIFLPVICLIFIFVDAFDSATKDIPSISSIFKTRNIILFAKKFIVNLFSQKNIFLVGACWLGALAGIIINPYFPRNISFYLVQTFQIPFFVGNEITLGSEWNPISQISFFTTLLLPLLLICLSLAMIHTYKPKLDIKSKLFLVLTILFALATFKSQRNIEYLTPIAIITSGIILTLIPTTLRFQEDADDFRKKILPFIKLNFLTIFIIIIFFSCLCSIMVNIKLALGNNRFDRFEKASAYISSQTRPGDIIYHSSWDEFPALFYFDDRVRYISGLDPTFLYLSNAQLYQESNGLTFGKNPDQAYNIIKYHFQAKYVFAGTKWDKFITAIDKDPRFQKVYSDSNAIVYKVL